ncbi:MAG: hypothetical protein PHQ35_01555 [Phycisphaerae bacterium]|nr:hypothetical protein [Phycisphaerae bacterium]
MSISVPISRKNICFIRSGSVETIVDLDSLLFKHFAKVFDEVFFLDVSKVFTSKLILGRYDNDSAYHRLPAGFKVVCPKKLSEVKKFLRSNDVVAICCFSETWPDWWIHHYLRKYSIPLIYIYTHSVIASFQYKKSYFNDFRAKLKNLAAHIRRRFPSHDFLADIDTYFVSDKHKAEKKKPSSRYKEVVVTNSRFYDSLLVSNHKISTDYVVFLDSMEPYHDDQIVFGYQPIDRELYYRNLNTILDTISRILKKELVVCLHPKYDDDNLKRDFGERKTVKYKTAEFVAQAEVVLFHESSSINNAFVYGKKVIQLTGKYFNDFTKRNCEACNKVFLFPTLDMFEWEESSLLEILYGLRVDSERYSDFLSNRIITSGQKGVPSFVQIADHVSHKYGISKKGGN